MPGNSPASARPSRNRTVEAPRADTERGGAREQSPGQHDARDPQPRADLLQDDVARHLEQEVAPEEGARRHAVDGGIKAQLLVHGERGEADIDAVEIAQEIRHNRERQHAPIDLAHRRLLDGSARHDFLPERFCSFWLLAPA